MLRWAVDQALGWKIGNEYGFYIERSTISRNGEAVVPIERKMLVKRPLKPRPLEEWETLANQDQNIAVLTQALFGETFKTLAPKTGVLGKITAVNDELEQRFTFALLAAEQSFEGAKLAGWGLEDTSIVPGEGYVYKVTVALPEDANIKIKEGSTYAGTHLYEKLPQPIGLAGIFKDSHVVLSWNYNLLSSIYTSYIVEKSADSLNFEKQNQQPIFNASPYPNDNNIALYYTDSIPNDKSFYYRIKGKTAFDEVGPASSIVQGKGKKSLEYVPRIYKKEIPTDNRATLYWEIKEEGNELISKFQLNRANTNDGPFKTVIDNIPPTSRSISYDKLDRINYFTVSAVDKNGTKSESLPVMVQPVDSVPPAAPKGLMGVMDTTGVVRLSWDKNLEGDLKGYRIFRSNNPNVEFTEVTKETYITENYNDTLPIRNLNSKVYYKLQAEDQRYNRSTFSKILEVNKPDLNPPSPPVLTKYEVLPEGTQINWSPSSSPDVASHTIFRKAMGKQEELWEKIHETGIRNDNSFLDAKKLEGNQYSYIVVAKDSAGLESAPSDPLTVAWSGKIVKDDDFKFSGTVNRELRFIHLSWKIKDQEVLEYRLYRGTMENDLKLFKTFNKNVTSFNDIDLKVNSEYTYGLQFVLISGTLSPFKKLELKY
ncbi:Fibronectin type-III repeats protein [Zobellia galactanivorans]|uniref:Fibronectin type-III repeats protein n=2 Tax=Zobellia galactanivorans (strain DSM 12802 / CCUG 47099 / CIP 106680 / NCIMB 13871 / Dsij) TaxID=63186 RepID=G0L3U0_ZOBGA|nr:Fibronectin type-III repeats protein [Zobellia galactanivorans]